MREYYERRAPEYDDWYRGEGQYAARDRPGWGWAGRHAARRVAPELLVIDSARRAGVPAQRMDPRVLEDGSRHVVFKRWFTPEQLCAELGGGTVVHAGRWFVAVLSR